MNEKIPNPQAAFYWGVSTSGYQHEGGYNTEGAPLNNWFPWENSERVPKSGRTTDFWNRYENDFSIAQKMGLNAFRLSIEWARIQPSTDPDSREIPSFDDAALRRYGDILVSARKKGLEPFVTLFHFTTPLWLGLNPWLDEKTSELFANFAIYSLSFLNKYLVERGLSPLQWIITVNEPNMLVINTYNSHSFPSEIFSPPDAPLQSLQNLCIAHCKAYRRIHRLYGDNPDWGKPSVSLNNYSSDLYWMDKFIVDILSAPSSGIPEDRLFSWLHERYRSFNEEFRKARLQIEKTPPYWVGMFIKWLHHWMGVYLIRPTSFQRLVRILYEEPGSMMDFIAIDYYDPFIGDIFRFPRFDEILSSRLTFRDWIMHSVTAKWWDWRILPQGLGFFVGVYAKDFPGMKIIIAENGMALRKQLPNDRVWREDSVSRSEYLRQHLREVERLRDEGKPLSGYFHWSLTDNYEWGSFAPRFGLYGVDFESTGLERICRQSDGDEAARTYSQLIGKASLNRETK